VHLDPPAGSTSGVVEVDLVHEHVQWFGKAQRLEVELVARRRIALLGSAERILEVLRALLLVPEIEPVILDWDEVQPRRYDYPHLQGMGGYLFGHDGTARIGAVLRSARVLGRPAGHLELAGFERLLIVDDGLRPEAPPRRERLYVLTTARAAQRLGVPVTQVLTELSSAVRQSRALKAVAVATTVADLPALLRSRPTTR
jgi:hypothetical protein